MRNVNNVDLNVANRIKEKRLVMGLSREQLASKIGVTHQQLSKYETGKNRITIGRLVAISNELKEPLEYFIQVDNDIKLGSSHLRMQMQVARNFNKINNQKQKEAVNKLILALTD